MNIENTCIIKEHNPAMCRNLYGCVCFQEWKSERYKKANKAFLQVQAWMTLSVKSTNTCTDYTYAVTALYSFNIGTNLVS